MTGHSGFPEFAGMTCQFFDFPLPHSEIHDTLAVIANKVKQSSKTKCIFLNHLDCHVGFASSQ
ncbi:MAG: hypothetical protein AWT59_0845 [Candidatus Gallionella acididurans]|uniref:Uncharacterized protein n=1 Tax=Candidatus Gallionella acididurans TaxID=1796491 RepID=A0A139BVJ0_9PROT|nr:MAG: hypothetical protein AWT59_0845 [Candidatus Gallionella acididurans]